ncbi:hypothetical protein COT79_00995 [Candidatus Berkelbacteria bacterium CG10_big_fil_rev_8_21_14_0_10_43_14]|uniref:Uncharacterized protein n=1 Tax=Candidatus Berkelbacteria bacterium CG10_big_fil_rev_8_21_14_0_10_43_14 TaxID=1974515 RepID=A0A2M6R9D7_9BACT|nr:MAG: hypothetical protein COT79_00995 [Candidatus Berkelbacteria bacterium CG10_big_fil_rev_8_21_14_0_10_43_14]
MTGGGNLFKSADQMINNSNHPEGQAGTHLITTEDLNTMQKGATKPLETALGVADTPVTQTETLQPTIASTPTAEVAPHTGIDGDDDLMFPGTRNLEESNANEAKPLTSPTVPGETTPFDAYIDTKNKPEAERTNPDMGPQLAAEVVELQTNGGSREKIKAIRDQIDALLQESIKQERAQKRDQRRQEHAQAVADFKQNVADGVHNNIDAAKANVDLVTGGVKMGAEKYLINPLANAGDKAKEVIEIGKGSFAEAKAFVEKSRAERTLRREAQRIANRNEAMKANLAESKLIKQNIDTFTKHIKENIAGLLQDGTLKSFMDQLSQAQENLRIRLEPYGESLDEHAKQNILAGQERLQINRRYTKEHPDGPIDTLASLKALLKSKVEQLKGVFASKDSGEVTKSVDTLEKEHDEEQKKGIMSAVRERLTKARETVGNFIKNNKVKTIAAIGIAMGLVMSLMRTSPDHRPNIIRNNETIAKKADDLVHGMRAPQAPDSTPTPNVAPTPADEPSLGQHAETAPKPKENLTPEEKSYLDKIKGIYDTMVAKNQGNNEVIGHLTRIYDQIKANPSTHEWSLTGLDEAQFNNFVDRYFTYENMPAGPTKDAEKSDFKELLDQHNIKLGGINGPLKAPTGFIDPSAGMTKEKAQHSMSVANNIAQYVLNPNIA